jgi:hypothetical protein
MNSIIYSNVKIFKNFFFPKKFVKKNFKIIQIFKIFFFDIESSDLINYLIYMSWSYSILTFFY